MAKKVLKIDQTRTANGRPVIAGCFMGLIHLVDQKNSFCAQFVYDIYRTSQSNNLSTAKKCYKFILMIKNCFSLPGARISRH